MYQDHDGNIVHHFNIPGRHSRLTVTAEAFVECRPPDRFPPIWASTPGSASTGPRRPAEFWDELNPSPYAHGTPLLDALADEIGLARGDDPLCTVKKLMADVHTRFEYSPKSTRVDSPIDDALSAAARRLPGLRPRDDRARPPPRHSVPLRQRLPVPGARRHGAVG